MRTSLLGLATLVLSACADATPPPVTPPAKTPVASPPKAAAPRTEKLAADAPRTTAEGATFIAPAG